MPATANSPLVNPENSNERLSRKFLGSYFPSNTLERKELKAYLQGHQYFFYKGTGEETFFDEFGQIRKGHKVRQEYFYTKVN